MANPKRTATTMTTRQLPRIATNTTVFVGVLSILHLMYLPEEVSIVAILNAESRIANTLVKPYQERPVWPPSSHPGRENQVQEGYSAPIVQQNRRTLGVDEPLRLGAGPTSRMDTSTSSSSFRGTTDEEQQQELYGYQSLDELRARSQRFPSLDDRVRYYMSNWYLPPCDGNDAAHIRYAWRHANHSSNSHHHQETDRELWIQELADPATGKQRTLRLSDRVQMNRVIYFNRTVHADRCRYSYCDSTMQTIDPAMRRLGNENVSDEVADHDGALPPIFQYGDSECTIAYEPAIDDRSIYPNMPVMKKFRWVLQEGELERITAGKCRSGQQQPPATRSNFRYVNKRKAPEDWTQFQPIVVKLKMGRHFGMLTDIPSYDRPWHEKKSVAAFRAGVTGANTAANPITPLVRSRLTDVELCQRIERCNLVYSNINSTIVDARLVKAGDYDLLPESVNGVSIFGNRMNYSEMLQNKALIMLQGHDVATGLKWALFSNSVVMMPPPTKTSWAMEELLQPWIHYIPLQADLSDVEEKMQWILENDAEAERIAYQGSLWIRDLVFHPDAEQEENNIFDEIVRRFQSHFVPGLLSKSTVGTTAKSHVVIAR